MGYCPFSAVSRSGPPCRDRVAQQRARRCAVARDRDSAQDRVHVGRDEVEGLSRQTLHRSSIATEISWLPLAIGFGDKTR